MQVGNRRRKLSLFGSFGFGNFGDEIVPYCFENLTRSCDQKFETKIFSRYNDLLVEGILDHRTFLKSEIDEPIILAGGGIIENNKMGCLNRALERKKNGKALNIVPFAISVEPGVKFNPLSRFRLHKALKQELPVFVRDELSANVLKRLTPYIRSDMIGDLGLWCEAGDIEDSLSEILPNRFISVILSDNWLEEEFRNWITNELIELALDQSAALVMLPISLIVGNDVNLAIDVANRIQQKNPTIQVEMLSSTDIGSVPKGSTIASILSRSICTVSMRLHGCVVSYAQKTPFIALAYHPKLFGFARTVNWQNAVIPEVLPRRQSTDVYGYKFSDLKIASGSCVQTLNRILKSNDFDALERLRSSQRDALNAVIAIQN